MFVEISVLYFAAGSIDSIQVTEISEGLRITWSIAPAQICSYSIIIDEQIIEQNINYNSFIVKDFTFHYCVAYQIEIIPVGVNVVGDSAIKMYKKGKGVGKTNLRLIPSVCNVYSINTTDFTLNPELISI